MAFPSPRFILKIGNRQIDYSRDYGIDKQSGWCVMVDGAVLHPQFTTFWRAVWQWLFFRFPKDE